MTDTLVFMLLFVSCSKLSYEHTSTIIIIQTDTFLHVTNTISFFVCVCHVLSYEHTSTIIIQLFHSTKHEVVYQS